MKPTLPALFGAVLALLHFSGCAGVQIHDSAGNDTDIPVRMPEPYVLVSPPDGEGKVAIQVITLPTGKKLRLTPRAGFGSASLEFTLQNAALASWGSTQDSTAADSITALVGAVTALTKQPEDPENRKPRLYRIILEDPNGQTTGKVRLEFVEGFLP